MRAGEIVDGSVTMMRTRKEPVITLRPSDKSAENKPKHNSNAPPTLLPSLSTDRVGF